MDPSTRLLNLILICIVNGLFLFIGIFLNSIVTIGFLKSKMLMKRFSCFMILILTCFDSVTVTVCHPLIIVSSYTWSTGDYNASNINHRLQKYSNIFFHCSFMALVVMNIDRFLAVSRPFFHRQHVTKKRLLALLLGLVIMIVIEKVLAYQDIFGIICYAADAVLVVSLLAVFFFINYKMHNIANHARRDVRSGVSTCILAVGCFFGFSAPLIIYSAIQFYPEALHEDSGMLLHLWTSTFACMNSSVNCLIFFYKDSTLRREGMRKIWPSFRRREGSVQLRQTVMR